MLPFVGAICPPGRPGPQPSPYVRSCVSFLFCYMQSLCCICTCLCTYSVPRHISAPPLNRRVIKQVSHLGLTIDLCTYDVLPLAPRPAPTWRLASVLCTPCCCSALLLFCSAATWSPGYSCLSYSTMQSMLLLMSLLLLCRLPHLLTLTTLVYSCLLLLHPKYIARMALISTKDRVIMLTTLRTFLYGCPF